MREHLTAEQLEALLTDYGWAFERVGEGRWLSGFAGEQRTFPLQVELNNTCVSFKVDPFIELDPGEGEGEGDPERSRSLMELLETNERMQLAKLGMSDSGDVILSCQALTAGFGREHLAQILGIVGYYADTLAGELATREDVGSVRHLLS